MTLSTWKTKIKPYVSAKLYCYNHYLKKDVLLHQTWKAKRYYYLHWTWFLSIVLISVLSGIFSGISFNALTWHDVFTYFYNNNHNHLSYTFYWYESWNLIFNYVLIALNLFLSLTYFFFCCYFISTKTNSILFSFSPWHYAYLILVLFALNSISGIVYGFYYSYFNDYLITNSTLFFTTRTNSDYYPIALSTNSINNMQSLFYSFITTKQNYYGLDTITTNNITFTFCLYLLYFLAYFYAIFLMQLKAEINNSLISGFLELHSTKKEIIYKDVKQMYFLLNTLTHCCYLSALSLIMFSTINQTCLFNGTYTAFNVALILFLVSFIWIYVYKWIMLFSIYDINTTYYNFKNVDEASSLKYSNAINSYLAWNWNVLAFRLSINYDIMLKTMLYIKQYHLYSAELKTKLDLN